MRLNCGYYLPAGENIYRGKRKVISPKNEGELEERFKQSSSTSWVGIRREGIVPTVGGGEQGERGFRGA